MVATRTLGVVCTPDVALVTGVMPVTGVTFHEQTREREKGHDGPADGHCDRGQMVKLAELWERTSSKATATSAAISAVARC